MDYLNLIIFPSKTLDKLNKKKPSSLTLYFIFTASALGLTLPQLIAKSLNSSDGLFAIMTYLIIAIPLMYYIIPYSLGYCYYIVSKGFKGTSSFIEMRDLVVFSTVPFIMQLVISIPFVSVGLINNNTALVSHENYLTSLILWILSFRILMVGIAKYNKFNWAITIITWVIATLPLTGLAYLRIMLK
jgi:hypothetical protein